MGRRRAFGRICYSIFAVREGIGSQRLINTWRPMLASPLHSPIPIFCIDPTFGYKRSARSSCKCWHERQITLFFQFAWVGVGSWLSSSSYYFLLHVYRTCTMMIVIDLLSWFATYNMSFFIITILSKGHSHVHCFLLTALVYTCTSQWHIFMDGMNKFCCNKS